MTDSLLESLHKAASDGARDLYIAMGAMERMAMLAELSAAAIAAPLDAAKRGYSTIGEVLREVHNDLDVARELLAEPPATVDADLANARVAAQTIWDAIGEVELAITMAGLLYDIERRKAPPMSEFKDNRPIHLGAAHTLHQTLKEEAIRLEGIRELIDEAASQIEFKDAPLGLLTHEPVPA